MAEHHIVEILRSAASLAEAGDEHLAQSLLTGALREGERARTEADALAIAGATQLLIELDAGLLPWDALTGHLDRMRELTAGFDGGDVCAARAAAELASIEWVHGAGRVDSATLVEVRSAASGFASRAGGSPHPLVRRAGAEAGFTAQMIREWLGEDPSAIALGFESLALGLAAEHDQRMRHLRVSALFEAARIRVKHGEDSGEGEEARGAAPLLRLVVADAQALPSATGLYYAATLHLADLAIAAGLPAREALAEAFEALHAEVPESEGAESEGPESEGPATAARRCRHLEGILTRVPAEERDAVARAEWGGIIARYASHANPEVREAMLEQLRFRGGDVADLGVTDLLILQDADAAMRGDTDPRTAEARLRVAARIVETLGLPDAAAASSPRAPRRDPAEAIRIADAIASRFPGGAADPELSPILADIALTRALRLSEIGRSGEAIAAVSALRTEFAAGPADRLRHRLAQAEYWRGRLNREAGNRAEAAAAVDAIVGEFAGDADPDVRVWAANALFSAWRDTAITPDEADALFERHLRAFEADTDERIGRQTASGLLNRAVRMHERGASAAAARELAALIAAYERAADSDPDIRDTVRLARENLQVLSLSAGHAGSVGDTGAVGGAGAAGAAGAAGDASRDRYRLLRERLTSAEERAAAGRFREAEEAWRNVADEASGSSDPNLSVLGLAALDAWAGYLNDTGQWPTLVDVARRGMLSRERLDYRAERMRARAYLRCGIALGQTGDALAAIATYEALDALTAVVADEEVMTTRQQAVYNRAILIDDIGHPQAAIHAYAHVLAVHAVARETPERRLRQVKALRNQALLLEAAGRIAEAAGAHNHVLGLTSVAPDAALIERARPSAFTLAECYTRLADHAAAAQTYEWIRTQPFLGLSKADLKRAASAQRDAERAAKRAGGGRGTRR